VTAVLEYFEPFATEKCGHQCNFKLIREHGTPSLVTESCLSTHTLKKGYFSWLPVCLGRLIWFLKVTRLVAGTGIVLTPTLITQECKVSLP